MTATSLKSSPARVVALLAGLCAALLVVATHQVAPGNGQLGFDIELSTNSTGEIAVAPQGRVALASGLTPGGRSAAGTVILQNQTAARVDLALIVDAPESEADGSVWIAVTRNGRTLISMSLAEMRHTKQPAFSLEPHQRSRSWFTPGFRRARGQGGRDEHPGPDQLARLDQRRGAAMSCRAATVLLIWAIGGFAIGLAAAAGGPVLFGMKSFAVLSGSMEPVLSTGDIVVEDRARATSGWATSSPTTTPTTAAAGSPTASARSTSRGGRARFVTKGDANDSAERWQIDATARSAGSPTGSR